MKTQAATSAELNARELQLYRRRIAIEVEVGALEQQLAEADSEGEFSRATARRTALVAEASGLGVVAATVRSGKADAIQRHYAFEANRLRTIAATKRAERDGLMRQSEKALRELSRIEGISYTPAILGAQPVGGWLISVNAPAGSCADDVSPSERVADGGVFAIPRSRQLLNEANELEWRASQLDQMPIRDSGQADGKSVEQLLENLLSDPFVLTPPIDAVAAWAYAQIDKFRRDFPTSAIGTARFACIWAAGQITDQSFAELQPAAKAA